MSTPKKSEEPEKKKRPPARTPEARENQMIALAFDQAELQLREGVAPAPVVVHYLKLATKEKELALRKLELESELLIKRADQVDATARLEELYDRAIKSMVHYQGRDEPEAYEEYGD